jgi:hypothetical protein
MYYDTIIMYMAVLGLSLAVSMMRRNEGFSFNIFMGSIAIGISVLIWASAIPEYIIVLPILMLVGMLFSDKITGSDTL